MQEKFANATERSIPLDVVQLVQPVPAAGIELAQGQLEPAARQRPVCPDVSGRVRTWQVTRRP